MIIFISFDKIKNVLHSIMNDSVRYKEIITRYSHNGVNIYRYPAKGVHHAYWSLNYKFNVIIMVYFSIHIKFHKNNLDKYD